MQEVHLLKLLFCDGSGTLTSKWRSKTHNHQEDFQHCPIKRKISSYFVRYRSTASREAEQYLAVPRSSINYILLSRLHVLSYKLQNIQQLKDKDYTAPTEFSNWCVQNMQSYASFLNRLVYLDECVSQVEGKVNKQNVRIGETDSDQSQRKMARNSKK